MKDLIISSSDYNHITRMVDEAEISVRYGNQVYFLLCNRNFGYCACNMRGSVFKCLRCERYVKALLRKCSPGIKVIEMDLRMKDQLGEEINRLNFDYHSIEDIKSIEYKGAKVGMSCLSTYVTNCRNNNPLLDEDFRLFFDKLLRTACYYAEFQLRMINEIKPDRIQLFNGRCLENRAASDFAIQQHILLRSCELWKVFPHYFVKHTFYNALPHNIEDNTKRINNLWSNESVPLEEKEWIGRRFFESKYNHTYSGDKDYTAHQVAEKMPTNWDYTKKNYVIFNSSEDEYTAIGDDYDQGKVFHSQYEGILHIANVFKDRSDVNVYLRIHPNLSNIKYKYHTKLLDLNNKFKNFHVIRGDSDVSSYAMMREAYRIVTFGSTTGVEASYMGKPVISLRCNWFSGMDVCYDPTTVEEAERLLLANDLTPKPQINAIKFGYYCMNPSLPSYSFFDFNISDFTIFGRRLRRYALAKYFGSTTLYALVGWVGEFLCKRDHIPIKEK